MTNGERMINARRLIGDRAIMTQSVIKKPVWRGGMDAVRHVVKSVKMGMGSVNQYVEGTIIIDFLDPGKKILVWHGRGAGFNLDSFNKREQRLREGVSEILAQYPPSATR
ncbi:MAG: DUF4136 domain-containing protein [Pedobacter sp.]|nr:MAG: DUF4136 domain-containing protein [Pedobacter sp.]